MAIHREYITNYLQAHPTRTIHEYIGGIHHEYKTIVLSGIPYVVCSACDWIFELTSTASRLDLARSHIDWKAGTGWPANWRFLNQGNVWPERRSCAS